VDMLDAGQLEAVCAQVRAALDWTGREYRVSALNGLGTPQLCEALMGALEVRRRRLAEDEDFRAAEEAARERMESEARESSERARQLWREKKKAAGESPDDDDEAEVFYTHD